MKPIPTSAASPATRERLERRLLTVLLLLLALAIAAPMIGQPAHHHDFADHRLICGIPFAMDVLSNLPFAAWGVMGVWLAWPVACARRSAFAHQRDQGRMALLFFGGLLATAACSAWYHLGPDNAGLVVDRIGMVVAFAGLLGLAAGGRISARAGRALAGMVLLLGPLSVAVWSSSGNVAPWLVLQFGGMALVLWFAFLPRRPAALDVRWGAVIAFYALAKLFEMADAQVFELTGYLVSGHSLKHVVASFAALPVLAALWQNYRETMPAGRQKQGRIGRGAQGQPRQSKKTGVIHER